MEPGNPDPLLNLLALKRHEPPPPGYFDRFSAGVRARIEAEARAPKLTGWQQWLAAFDVKPILVGAYGVALVGLVLVGFNWLGKASNPTGAGFRPVHSTEFQLSGQPTNHSPEPVKPGATALAGATNLFPPSQTSAPPGFLTNPGTGTFPAPPTPAGFTPNR